MSNKILTAIAEIEVTFKNGPKTSMQPGIYGSADAYQLIESHWSNQMELIEEFNILLLNRQNKVMGMCSIGKGGQHNVGVDLKLAFATALKGRASAIILCHNHPSGNLKPSSADLQLTKSFSKAGEILQISVLDHLILSPEGGYYSFKDNGLM